MISFTDKGGKEVFSLSPEKITAFGVVPLTKRKLWIKCDGLEYSTEHNVDSQHSRLRDIFAKANGKIGLK